MGGGWVGRWGVGVQVLQGGGGVAVGGGHAGRVTLPLRTRQDATIPMVMNSSHLGLEVTRCVW